MIRRALALVDEGFVSLSHDVRSAVEAALELDAKEELKVALQLHFHRIAVEVSAELAS